MYRIPLVENIIFLENQHAQGQTYIPIIGFPDPNLWYQSYKL